MVKKTKKNIVILIQPKVGYLDSVKTNYAIPLALLSVASMIHKDYEVIIFDQRIHSDWEKKIDRLLEKNPVCIGLTSMTGEQLYYALEISKRIKSKGNYPVIWGGIHPTLDSHNVLKNKNIDIVVRGEGEETFKELINHLEKNKNIKSIKGISFKSKEGKIISNPERGFIDLNKLPEIPYNLIVRNIFIKILKNKHIKIKQSIDLKNLRYKPIILGKNGDTIKKIRESSQNEIANIMKSKVHLYLQINKLHD
ncbi:MAG: cobalamin-dependent protein [Candidatus Pacearchaeota archaeon]|nr:cobalamin-dependent protein [Candidatus Pacearchaeota archaeon]